MKIKRIQTSIARTGLSIIVCLTFTLGGAHRGNAAEYYVTPEGAGLADGSSWANAFSNVQDAVYASVTAGDVVYLRHGEYENTETIQVMGKDGMTLAGGYQGVIGQFPGPTTNSESVLTQNGSDIRIVDANASTVTLSRVTIANGYSLGAEGAGLRLVDCDTTLSNCVVRNNTGQGGGAFIYGGAVYAQSGSLALISTGLYTNELSKNLNSVIYMYGGGVYAQGVNLSVSNCVFRKNRTIHLGKSNYEYFGYGGALYLDGGSASISSSEFDSNYCQIEAIRECDAQGGAIYADNVNPLVIDDSEFLKNWVRADNYWPDTSYDSAPVQAGGLFYLTGASLDATISDCRVTRNAGPAGFGDLRVKNGSVALDHCLIALGVGGVIVDGGSVSIGNSTLADNIGWGVKQSSGSLAISNSVVWGNTAGGIDAVNPDISYTCSQETFSGTGNLVADPLFVAGYYLAVDGLTGQDADSPCIDTGTGNAADYGLDDRTTRTDGTMDSGSLDLGYHYPEGFSGNLSNLQLFVDASAGNNANNGWTAGQPLQTLTEALDRAIPGTTIAIASGSYTQHVGETFPLEIGTDHVSIIGSGAETTVLDAAGSGERVLNAVARGRVRLESLTFQNGVLTEGEGAGLYLVGNDARMKDCVVRQNRIEFNQNPGTVRGGGIFAAGGTFTLENCTVADNYLERIASSAQGGTLYGGGIYSEDVELSMENSLLEDNYVSTGGNWNYDLYVRGGGVFVWDGSANITNTRFIGNYGYTPHPRRREALGGALYAFRLDSMTVTDSTFEGNWCGPWKYTPYGPNIVAGGVMYLAGKTEVFLDRCLFADNRNEAAAPDWGDIRLASGDATLRMTNCLVTGSVSNGVTAQSGAYEMVNSTVADSIGWGVFVQSANAVIHNSLLWGNTVGGIRTNAGDIVTYTLSQEAHPGAENQVADPLFAAAQGNYRLQDGSPALNAGLNADWMQAATDLDGNPRILRTTVDLGAYELPPPAGTVLLIR